MIECHPSVGLKVWVWLWFIAQCLKTAERSSFTAREKRFIDVSNAHKSTKAHRERYHKKKKKKAEPQAFRLPVCIPFINLFFAFLFVSCIVCFCRFVPFCNLAMKNIILSPFANKELQFWQLTGIHRLFMKISEHHKAPKGAQVAQ